MTRMATAAATDAPLRDSQIKVIAASSLGTVFEWYDFYLYGLLATVITAQFFSGLPPSPRGSRCGRSGRWCSGGSAISSDARTPSS